MTEETTIERPRLRSLDVLRGAAVAGMILVNSQLSPAEAYPPLAHAAWNGWTLADTVFPAFLFMVGISLTLSTASRLERGADRASLVRHAVRRSLLLFACGVLLDLLVIPHRGFPFVGVHDHLQLTGVLEKIALCYLAAFLIYLGLGVRGAAVGIVVLNAAYLGLLYLYPVPSCGAGVLTPTCSFPAYVNQAALNGFTWGPTYDPDGLGALLPAITSVLFGVLAGWLWRTEPRPRERMRWLALGGGGLVAAGVALGQVVPVNKPLWTPSYVLLMAGLAALALAASAAVVDVRGWARWFRPLEILGLNAVAAYLFARPADHLLRVHVLGRAIPDLLRRMASPPAASLCFSLVVLLAVQAFAWLLYRQRWFLKL